MKNYFSLKFLPIIFILSYNIYSNELESYSLYINTTPFWSQRILITDITGKKKGVIEIKQFSTLLEDKTTGYISEIFLDANLPFWFFSSHTRTYENEILDSKDIPIKSFFEQTSKNEKYKIELSRVLDINRKNAFELKINHKNKHKIEYLETKNNILTPGNLRNLVIKNILLNNIENSRFDFYLLDKIQGIYRKIVISKLNSKVINNVETIKLNIDINILGKFFLFIDKDFNIVYGEGMGIRIFPEKNDLFHMKQ